MIVDLRNKVIVITGASKGIGRALALKLSRENAKVVINYLHSENSARELLNEIKEYNKGCMICKADISKYEDVLDMYHKVIERYKKVDILINNAGICDDNRINFMSEQQWFNILNVNLTGAFFCSKVFSRAMIKQRNGKIFFISSLKGQEGCIGQSNYSASKAGVFGLAKTLAKELGTFNILVNTICPGFIVTDLNRHNKKKIDIAEAKSALEIGNCLSDLVDFMVYACSDKIKGVSGRTFNLDSRIN